MWLRIIENKKLLVGILIFLGLATRLIFLTNPAEVVFDEVHFGKFVSSYFTGKYYFDIHPPLGKMIIAAGAFFGGYGDYASSHGVFPFKNIGDDYGSMPYFWFRIFPALAGALIPLSVFLFATEVGLDRIFSFLAGLFVIFENSILVESRLILTDSFLILFGFLGLYLFFKSRNNDYQFWLLAVSGFFFSLSVLVKWTGLGFWGAAGVIYAWDMIRDIRLAIFLPAGRQIPAIWRSLYSRFVNFDLKPEAKLDETPRTKKIASRIVIGALAFIILPFLLYFAVFQIHFSLLPDCPETGEGNGCDFMSQGFRSGKLNPWQEFVELNQKMWSYNKGISASHEYGSKALGWPLMIRSVYYWVKNISLGVDSRIYMIGNPLNWFLGLLGIFTFSFAPLAKEKKLILALLFLANFLPFILVRRVLFLYHYLFALIVSFVIFCFLCESLFRHFARRQRIFFLAGLLILVIGGFAFFAPLSYGLPLTSEQFQNRQWSGLWFSGNSGLKQICQTQGCSVLKWILY